MKHEDLLALTANPVFSEAKDFVVEGLSVKLNTFENAIKTDLQINTEPRSNYEGHQTPEGGNADQTNMGFNQMNFGQSL